MHKKHSTNPKTNDKIYGKTVNNKESINLNDPAGLSISTKMTAQIKGFQAAQKY